MAAARSFGCEDALLSDNGEEASSSVNYRSCLLMENNIQAFEKEVKSLTEIISILNDELKHDATEEVMKADCLCVDKLKSKNTSSYNCELIKPQLLIVLNELSSVIKITNIIREELVSMKHATNKNMLPESISSSIQSSNPVSFSTYNPKHFKTWTADNSQYSFPTSNRFDILSNYPESRYNEPECSPDLHPLPKFLP